MSVKSIFKVALLMLAVSCAAEKTNKEKMDELFREGLKADAKEDYKASIKYYTQVLEIDSAGIGALVNRGRAYIASGKLEEGFADLNRAVELKPNERTYYSRAISYLRIDSLRLAEIDLNLAMEANSKFCEAELAMSNIRLKQKNYLAALAYWKNGHNLKCNPTLAAEVRTDLIKKFGKKVVNRYAGDKVYGAIENLPVIKQLPDKLMGHNIRQGGKDVKVEYTSRLDSLTQWEFHVFVMNEADTLYRFRINAETYEVINPDGK